MNDAITAAYSAAAPRQTTSVGVLHGSLIGLCIIPFSPLAAWVALIAIAVFCGRSHQRLRRLLGWGIILCAALCYASRETTGVANDDFYYTYYPTFLTLVQEGFGSFLKRHYEIFGASMGVSVVELGFYTWLYLIGLICGKVSISTVIFLTTAAIALMYWVWLENYFLPEITPGRRGMVMALSLTLFSYGLCSQLSRQMFSIPFILAAVWEKRTWRAVVWILAGCFFHLSSLPIGVFGWAVQRWPRRCIVILAATLVSILIQPSMLNIFGATIAFDKFAYYSLGNSTEAIGFDLQYLYVGLSPAILGGLAIASRRPLIGYLMLGSSLVYVLLLPLPLASYRATLFVTGALLGPGLAAAFDNRMGRHLFAILMLAVALAMMSRRATLREPGIGMPLWQKYPRWEFTPFYYLAEIQK